MSEKVVEPPTSAVLEKPALLSICNVTKQFVVQERVVNALAATSLDIVEGEFICLLGASGCGKSTLLRIVAGFESATNGVVLMEGNTVAYPGPDRGMVFQDYGLFPWLTVRENIVFGLRQRKRDKASIAALGAQFLKMIGLEQYAEHYPSQLSGGMKQRVAIGRVLANECRCLLMDEPFGALDALTREKLQLELLTLWERNKLTIVFVTHSVEEAVLLADRVVVMSPSPGRIAFVEPIDLPRPRDIASPEFNALRRMLNERLVGSSVG